MPPSHGDPVMRQQLDYALGCTRDEYFLASRQSSRVDRMKAVNVFVGDNSLDYRILVKSLRQRKLDEYSVHFRVCVQLAQNCFELVLSRAGGEMVVFGLYPDLLRSSVFGFEIARACRIISYLYGGEERPGPMSP